MRFWWLNLEESIDDQISLGVAWFPAGEDGAIDGRDQEMLKRIREGDLVLLAEGERIRAVGRVKEKARVTDSPLDGRTGQGFELPVEMVTLRPGVSVEECPSGLFDDQLWSFESAAGGGICGEIVPLSREFVRGFLRAFSERLEGFNAASLADEIDEHVWVLETDSFRGGTWSAPDGSLREGNRKTWMISGASEMTVGDPVLIWRRSPEAGVYARGRVETLPAPTEEGGRDRREVVVEYVDVPESHVATEELREWKVLAELPVLRREGGRLTRANPRQWRALQRGFPRLFGKDWLRGRPLNTILYGPPGTGKTYQTRRRAVALCEPERFVRQDEVSDSEIDARFEALVDEGRIAFATFHQTYGYDDFIEGIRPVMGAGHEGGREETEVEYDVEDGVFKRMALRAAYDGMETPESLKEFSAYWEMLRERIAEGDGLYRGRVETTTTDNTVVFGDDVDGNIIVHSVPNAATATPERREELGAVTMNRMKMLWDARARFSERPEEVELSDIREALAETQGIHRDEIGLEHLRVFQELLHLKREQTFEGRGRLEAVRRALEPETRSTFEFGPGSDRFVLIVDEINRGNLSKIFGELITLLESDKRLSEPREFRAQLPYSKQAFSVPPNLHVIGTMNTADRSIALMDVALRRRFDFEEVMPDWRVVYRQLRSKLEGDSGLSESEERHVNLVTAIFETLNERIRFLYDRDHQLGHSYFLDATDLDSLKDVFERSVIPMLQEYFYGSWENICLTLGCPYDNEGRPRRRRQDDPSIFEREGRDSYAAPIIAAEALDEFTTLCVDHEDYRNQVDYEVETEFRNASGEALRPYFENLLSKGRRRKVEGLEYSSLIQGEAERGKGEVREPPEFEGESQ